jgi:hypothetical protein
MFTSIFIYGRDSIIISVSASAEWDRLSLLGKVLSLKSIRVERKIGCGKGGGEKIVAANVEEIYTRHLASLSKEDRLRLLAMLANSLAEVSPSGDKRHSLFELEGLGAEIWKGVDAQKYVDDLRNEWEQKS